MQFSVVILGCGSAAPTLARRPSAQVVNLRSHHFLVDCGEGTQIQLRKYKVKFQKINQIFISHLHGDHVFGLIGLLSTYHLLGRTKSLEIFGPVGIEEFIKTQLRLSEAHLNYELIFTELDLKEKTMIFENSVSKVYAFPLKHRIKCHGFLFEEKPMERRLQMAQMRKYGVSIAYANKVKQGNDVENENGELISHQLLSKDPPPTRSYAYCSDTTYYEPVADYVKGVDLLYHEATFLESLRDRAVKTFHSTALDAAKIAIKAEVKRLLIGHYSARYADSEPLVKEAQTIFRETTAAEDGMIVEITN